MKKFIISLFAILFFLVIVTDLKAASDTIPTVKKYKVAIFAPLYLDSVFAETGSFRYKEGMPKFIAPALDFINGAQIALDSMLLENDNIEATIYDTKSFGQPLSSLIKNNKLENTNLLIGSVRDADYKQLADFAQAKSIPFVSATYPNDGGITKNPYLLLVNSTLKAHCEAIYSFLLQSHGTDKIFLCRKKGNQEDKVASYFKMINEQDGKQLLNIQTLNFDSSISAAFIKTKLDSTKQSVFIGASLEEGFAVELAKAVNSLHEHYPLTLIGMPNWDGFRAFTKKESFENFPIFFTSPYYNTKTDSCSRQLTDAYSRRLKGKPTDVAFKGYECVRLFVKLLTLYPNDFMDHLNERSVKVFSDYNFRPVAKKGNDVTDYVENKHLYFIKILNGSVMRAW